MELTINTLWNKRKLHSHSFHSGYTADVIAHGGFLDEGMLFIERPFRLKDLASKVRRVMGGK